MLLGRLHCCGKKGYADTGFVELNMDWTTPLRSQQTDFIKRLKSGCLLHCETEGQHSELTVISGERLKQLRNFCWEMAEKYKRNSPVRKVFIDNMKGKLGEEVVKARLGNVVTEVDYEKRLGGDGKVDFTVTSNPEVGIQVKARHGSIDTVRWSISKEEIEKNTALICILIQEEVNEAQADYNLIMAGFVPIKIIQVSNGKASVGIDELLYSGGLRSYLDSLQFEDFFYNYQEIQQNSNQGIPCEPSPNITIGSWKYTLPLEELASLEAALKELREKQQNASTEVEIPKIHPSQQIHTLEQMWEEVLAHLQPPRTQALCKQHGHLLSFDGQVAYVGISSLPLLKLAQVKLPNIKAAFEKVFNSKIKVSLVAKPTNVQISNSSTSQQQQETQGSQDYEQIWKAGDRIIHEVFGTGQVTHVFGSAKKISLAIKFPIGQRLLDPQRAPMRRIESESF